MCSVKIQYYVLLAHSFCVLTTPMVVCPPFYVLPSTMHLLAELGPSLHCLQHLFEVMLNYHKIHFVFAVTSGLCII